jgi:hypothetical protein
MAIKNIIDKAEKDFSILQNTGAINSVSPTYELINQNFTAEIGKNYAIDTTIESISVTLPANPQTGDVIGFADARGTWATNPIVILRNGGLIEESEINFSNNAAGTFFVVLFIDSTTGWRVLASGTKPLSLTTPTVAGTYEFTSTNGTWTGSPTSYSYQWQLSTNGTSGWTNISGATSSTYTGLEADEGKYVRIGVVATNSNGPSMVVYSSASSAINIPDFPMSGLLAFWKLDNVNDASGNGNTLTNNNSVTFGAGKIGVAATFDGSNHLSRSSSSNWILSGTGATVNFWLRRSGSAASELIGNRIGAVYCPWALALDSNNKLRLLSNVGGGWAVTSGGSYGNTTIPDETWVMITIRKNTNGITVLINGSADSGITNVSSPTNTSSSPLYIGSGGDGSFVGSVDAIGFWSRSITDEEVTTLYNSGNGVEP